MEGISAFKILYPDISLRRIKRATDSQFQLIQRNVFVCGKIKIQTSISGYKVGVVEDCRIIE